MAATVARDERIKFEGLHELLEEILTGIIRSFTSGLLKEIIVASAKNLWLKLRRRKVIRLSGNSATGAPTLTGTITVRCQGTTTSDAASSVLAE